MSHITNARTGHASVTTTPAHAQNRVAILVMQMSTRIGCICRGSVVVSLLHA